MVLVDKHALLQYVIRKLKQKRVNKKHTWRSNMNTETLIVGLFCRIDDRMRDVKKHPQANLYPSEVVT